MIKLMVLVLFSSHAMSQIIQIEVDYKKIKCLVCQQVMKEVQKAISKINPDITINVGSYRLDKENEKTVPYRTSEGYLTELMEDICEKMDNFIRVKHRKTKEILVIPLLTDSGQMNPIMSEIDIIQDETLNKNLKLYCEEIIENYDEAMVQHLQNNKGLDSLDKMICGLVCKFVSDNVVKDEL